MKCVAVSKAFTKIAEERTNFNRKIPCTFYGLLTRCEGHTEKYRTAVFVQPELVRAVLKDQGPVFLSMARANPVNKLFNI